MFLHIFCWRSAVNKTSKFEFGRRLIFLYWYILVIIHPEVKNWIKYARFEEKNHYISSARLIYERAVEFFGEDNIDEQLFLAFTKFEEAQREVMEETEMLIHFVTFSMFKNDLLFPINDFSVTILFYIFQHERARVIYKYALDNLSKEKCEAIYKSYTIHEKKYGDRTAIEDVIVSKRKFKYEEVSV